MSKKTVEVNKDELVAAALNTPDEKSVVINNKEFKLFDFKYKDFIAFGRYIAPMLDLFLGGNRLDMMNAPKLNAMSILDFCADDLPKMGLMIAKNTYPDMTEDEFLDIVPSPFELADLVLHQMQRNRMIERLTGFLQQMTPQKQG